MPISVAMRTFPRVRRVLSILWTVCVLPCPGECPLGNTGEDDGRKGNWREASCKTVTFPHGCDGGT
ncbi:MAG: hypothetical protein OXC82_03930, partial [Rhodobacteraceae bacterium]|nr:hypothetical protein [Paracoccaceae bacterium]